MFIILLWRKKMKVKRLLAVLCSVLAVSFAFTACNDTKEPENTTPPGQTTPEPVTEYTVTFDANTGTLTGNATVKVESGKTVTGVPTAAKEGYRFDAWYTQATGGEVIDPATAVITKNTTIYAHWIKTYVVTFNAGAGTLTGNATVTVDENGKITGAPTAAKTGEAFYGWYTAATEGNKVNLSTYLVTGNVTLFAHYGEIVTMPIKTLKDKGGKAVGYRVEAENAKMTGEPNSDNQTHPGEFLEDPENASGGHSIGYFGKKGNTMTMSFNASAAGKATMNFLASSADIYMDFTSDFAMYPQDQEVTSALINVELNGSTVTFEPATLRGSYENFVFNKYWDSINLGELDIVAGYNMLVVTVLGNSAPNFDCLDIVTTLTLTSANGNAASGEATMPEPPAPAVVYDKNVTAKLIVVDHADGPAVQKAVLTFVDDIPAATIATNPFTVGGMGVADTDKVYLSDANGNKVSGTTSKYVTIEYAYSYSGWGPAGNVKPFNYDFMSGKNTWKDVSSYALAIKGLTLGGTTYTKFGGTFTAEYVVPELDKWDTNGSYTDGNITLKYASYAPAAAEGKTAKKPLIVWLHGAGEGGTDPSIVLLGNQVVNLGKSLIQDYFTTATCAGAYVLAPQAPTMWMDNGNGQQGGSNVGESIYTESLFKLIQKFVTEHTDIDANRVYIGGCSNGGWMTVEMLSKHGEFFAAAFPIAVPFDKDAGLTEAEFARLVSVPMWITHAKVDPTVQIGAFGEGSYGQAGPFQNYTEANSNSLYIELLKAGATNVHYSLFDTVTLTEGEDAATYNGHYSWIFTLLDKCKNVQAKTGTGANNAFTLADINENSTATVTLTAGGEAVTLWAWIAAQSKNA